MRFCSAGGDIIKGLKRWLFSILKCFFKSLHKEKTAQSIKIEAVNSIVILINNSKD